jgi:hypothetical protein
VEIHCQLLSLGKELAIIECCIAVYMTAQVLLQTHNPSRLFVALWTYRLMMQRVNIVAGARVCQFAERQCGGFEASASRGFLHAFIANIGTLPAAYTLTVSNCR